MPELRSDWRVEIPQHRPKNSAQVHQTLFLLGSGVWAQDYYYCSQVRQIESFLPERRQNLMFSATIPPRVERMAIQLMKEPLYTVIGKVLIT